MERKNRLTADDIEMLRSQGEARIDNLDDENLRQLRGYMFKLKRDGYSTEEIIDLTDSNPNVVRLLMTTRAEGI